jgi:hypothetical protein
VNSLTIDLLSLSVLGIFVLLMIIAVMIYLKLRPSKVELAMPRLEREILDEVRALRQDLRSKPPTSPHMMDNQRDRNSRFKESSTLTNLQLEMEKLHQDFELRFGAKFSNQAFGPDDAFAFFYAVSNSLERFDHDISSQRDIDVDIIREAQGYMAILRLILSWAQANGRDGIKAKAEEFLNAAEKVLEKAKAA